MSVETEVAAELTTLRESVAGVDGAVVATSDGLLVAHVLPEAEQSRLAALVASVAGLARHAVQITDRGDLLEAAVHGTAGFVVVCAVGDSAVLAVLARAEVNLALLQLRIRPVVEHLTGLSGRFEHFTSFAPATGG